MPTQPSFYIPGCDFEPQRPAGLSETDEACEPLEDADPSAPGLFTGWSEETCQWPDTSGDLDVDGILDACENATASSFAPMLIFASQDCNWDTGLNRMGGEYFFAVSVKAKTNPSTQVQYQVLRVAFLPAYYWDCGNASSAPFAAWFDPAHSGDSEFIILDVKYDAASHHWTTDGIFLSAHCGTPNDDNCKWYLPSAVQTWVDERPLGAPYIWVSRAKHANYMTEDQCDHAIQYGPYFVEDCEFDSLRRFAASYVQQNVGSRAQPLRDCAGPFSNSSLVNPSTLECMWTFELYPGGPLLRFNGWQSSYVGPAPGPYGKWLQDYAGF